MPSKPHLVTFLPTLAVEFRRAVENEGMSRTPQDRQTLRVRRSLLFIVVLTVWALYALDGDLFPPHGNSLVYAIALTWLVTIAIGLGTGFIFAAADPALFSLARWERDGEIYDRAGIRAFRWVLLRSGLGWINGQGNGAAA